MAEAGPRTTNTSLGSIIIAYYRLFISVYADNGWAKSTTVTNTCFILVDYLLLALYSFHIGPKVPFLPTKSKSLTF